MAAPASGPDPAPDLVASAPAYTLRNVLASAASVTPSAALAAPAAVAASPCLQRALLWGSGVALLLGAHRLRARGSALRAANDALLGWLGTAGLQWYLCRRDEHDRRLALRAFYQHRAQQQPLPLPPRDQGGDGAGGAAVDAGKEDWQIEIERLTSYDSQSRVVAEGGSTGVVIR